MYSGHFGLKIHLEYQMNFGRLIMVSAHSPLMQSRILLESEPAPIDSWATGAIATLPKELIEKHEMESIREAEAAALEEQLHLKALKPKSTTISSVTE
jgi:predicted alpha/beta superfamily hydrolase